VDVKVPWRSYVTLILYAIYTSGLIKWVKEYISAKALCFVDNLSWVETGRNHNQVISILKRCAGKSIGWASRQELQFNTAKRKWLSLCPDDPTRHFWLKVRALMMVGNGFTWFNNR